MINCGLKLVTLEIKIILFPNGSEIDRMLKEMNAVQALNCEK